MPLWNLKRRDELIPRRDSAKATGGSATRPLTAATLPPQPAVVAKMGVEESTRRAKVIVKAPRKDPAVDITRDISKPSVDIIPSILPALPVRPSHHSPIVDKPSSYGEGASMTSGQPTTQMTKEVVLPTHPVPPVPSVPLPSPGVGVSSLLSPLSDFPYIGPSCDMGEMGCLVADLAVEWASSCQDARLLVAPAASTAPVTPLYYLQGSDTTIDNIRVQAFIESSLDSGGDTLQYVATGTVCPTSKVTLTYTGTLTVSNDTLDRFYTFDKMSLTLVARIDDAPNPPVLVELDNVVVFLQAPVTLGPGDSVSLCLEDNCAAQFEVDISAIPEGSIITLTAALLGTNDATEQPIAIGAVSEPSFAVPAPCEPTPAGEPWGITLTPVTLGLPPYCTEVNAGDPSTVLFDPSPRITTPSGLDDYELRWSSAANEGGCAMTPGDLAGEDVLINVGVFTLDYTIENNVLYLRHVGGTSGEQDVPVYPKSYIVTAARPNGADSLSIMFSDNVIALDLPAGTTDVLIDASLGTRVLPTEFPLCDGTSIIDPVDDMVQV